MDSSSSPSTYVICHPEKLSFTDVFTSLVFGTTPAGSEVVDTSDNRNVDVNLIAVLILILQRILLWIDWPLELLGVVVEFMLNFFSLNGGILQLPFRLLTGSLVIPNQESADFRSIIGHVDGRTDPYQVSTIVNHLSRREPINSFSEISPLHLSMMASKVAYENKAYVENVVTNHWKMHFVQHDNFWNESHGTDDTQAFICCDRQENAQLIVVAFRGTDPFNAQDWLTDIDLSWMKIGEMGRVHVGFLNALGLQNTTDYMVGWPEQYTGSRRLAYYIIRDTLRSLLQQNKGARIIITGHSLGGALAILLPSVLLMHQERDIMSSLLGVYTFGQPRVGDQVFDSFMTTSLNSKFQRYYRVVFRYDIISRVPFDNPVSEFTHFGGCLYYRSWYKGEVTEAEPNLNYFNPLYTPSKYLNAWLDLFRALFAGVRHGKDFEETLVSLLIRILGLLIPGIASHSPRDYLNAVRLAKFIIT